MLRVTRMMSTFKIYTKTGDKGTSSLFNGERRPKNDLIFEAIGTVDELTSVLGVAKEFCSDDKVVPIVDQLEKIQCLLQDLNSNLATPRDKTANEIKLSKTAFNVDGKHTLELESWIDKLDLELEPLKNFILPGGGKSSSFLHVGRSVCRRTERLIVDLNASGTVVDQNCCIFINRLSDYLFTAARYCCLKSGKPEVVYRKQ